MQTTETRPRPAETSKRRMREIETRIGLEERTLRSGLNFLVPILGVHAGRFEPKDYTSWLDPDKVLYKVWNAQRLQYCKLKLERDIERRGRSQAPPIDVSCFLLRWHDSGLPLRLYVPSDGMHRSNAAHLAGQNILAHVSSLTEVSLDRFWVDSDYQLWLRLKGGDFRLVHRLAQSEQDTYARLLEMLQANLSDKGSALT